MTQDQAQAIYDNYNNKAGRRPADYYTALSVLGIIPTEKKSTARPQQTNKDNFIFKNDDVNENEKFRYIRIKQIQQMNSTNMTPQAHHLLLALMTSPNSNSLGAYKISISEMSAQTGGQDRNSLIKALNDLISLGEVRYIDGVVYLNKFLKNQKQHGNKDNLIGIIKNYNSLEDSSKLPYKGTINYQGITMTQLVDEFNKLMKAIQMMGLVASGAGINIEEYSDIYNKEQIIEIIENEKHSFAETSSNIIKPVAPAFITVPDVEEGVEEEQEFIQPAETIQQELKEVIQPVTQQLQQVEVIKQPQQVEVIKQPTLSGEEKFDKILQNIATGNFEKPQPIEKMTDDEIEDFIVSKIDTIPPHHRAKAKLILKKSEFNNVFIYVRNGGRNVEEIKKYYYEAIFLLDKKIA